jgi:hypothetical protein
MGQHTDIPHCERREDAVLKMDDSSELMTSKKAHLNDWDPWLHSGCSSIEFARRICNIVSTAAGVISLPGQGL